MEYWKSGQLHISRLGLGTVQFGFAYGINNRLGQVSYDEVLKILSTARVAGVNFLDTSRFYGTSEEIIGRAMEGLGLREDFIVCTKLDLPENYRQLSDRELIEAARSSLFSSMKALHLDRIPVYLLHTFDYKEYRKGIIWQYVLEEKSRGTVQYLGVSIARNPTEALACIRDTDVRAIQIPYNLFDSRWEEVFAAAAKDRLLVFSRSCYLQGMLLMSAKDAVRKVPAAQQYMGALEELSKELGIPTKELALRYVFSTPGIASTVIGVDSHEQFQENLRIYRQAHLTKEMMARIREQFKDVPDQVVNPALWNVLYSPLKGKAERSKPDKC